jgi:hypothetical protein
MRGLATILRGASFHWRRKRAARRAKTKMPCLCKAFGLDTMFTLTYRENQTDLDSARSTSKRSSGA